MGKIVFKDISFSYGKNVILKNFNLEVEDGQILCLVGPSGCGKTTLVRCLLGLNKPDTGEIWVGDTCLFSAEKRINVPVELPGLRRVAAHDRGRERALSAQEAPRPQG